jgi:hypothetical protein
MTATRTLDRPTQDDATQDRPTQDDWASYAEYLDSLPESLPVPEDDPEEADRDEAARVAAWLARHGLDAVPF